MLENFRNLMVVDERKEIKVTELYEAWMKHVAKNVETNNLEIDYDDEPSYECVEVTMEIEENESRSWSSFSHAQLIFECEHDEDMNFSIHLSRYNESRSEGWDINYDKNPQVSSLRHLNDFELFLMKLNQNYTKIILDSTHETDEVRPDEEPELSYT